MQVNQNCFDQQGKETERKKRREQFRLKDIAKSMAWDYRETGSIQESVALRTACSCDHRLPLPFSIALRKMSSSESRL